MKTTRLIPLVLSFFFCCDCAAQNEFAPIGAKWTYEAPWCPQWDHCWFYTLESTKDTIVANQSARLLEYSKHTVEDGAVSIPEANLIMYGDEDKVYYYLGGQFELLYDFGADVGDTVSINIGAPLNLNFYSTGSNPTDTCEIIDYVIDSISTVTISNQVLRVQYPRPVAPSDACWSFGTIVEKMGNLGYTGIFGNESNLVLLGVHGELRCYQDEFISYNESGVDCDFIFNPTSTKEIIDLDAAYFYPNPTVDNISISCPIQKQEQLQVSIFDVNGKLVYSKKQTLLPDQEMEITIDDKGVFFIKIELEDKIFTGQFIKN